MNIPTIEELEKSHYKCYKLIKYHYPDFYHFLINKYQDYDYESFSEIVYCYYNSIFIHPVCPICRKPLTFRNFTLGYTKYCSSKCSSLDPSIKVKIKQTFLRKYGVDNPAKSNKVQEKIKETNLKRYGGVGFASKELMDKTKQTNLERYGVENPFQLEEIKEKIKETNLERYGVEHPLQSKEIQNKTKQTCLDRYGVEYYAKLDEFKKYISDNSEEITRKGYLTKKENNSFNTSKCEQEVKQWLDDNNIEYKYQYKSELYPFACDFYFPDKDLYFEIQGSWCHGGHPFNPDSQEDKNLIDIWKSKSSDYYQYAASIWSKSDPYKRQIATYNELNWHETFSNNSKEIIEKLKELLSQ